MPLPWKVAAPLALILALASPARAFAGADSPARSASQRALDGSAATVSVSGSLDPGYIGLSVAPQGSASGPDQPGVAVSITVYSDGAWILGVSDPMFEPGSTLAGSGTASVSIELGQSWVTVDPLGASSGGILLGVVPGY